MLEIVPGSSGKRSVLLTIEKALQRPPSILLSHTLLWLPYFPPLPAYFPPTVEKKFLDVLFADISVVAMTSLSANRRREDAGNLWAMIQCCFRVSRLLSCFCLRLPIENKALRKSNPFSSKLSSSHQIRSNEPLFFPGFVVVHLFVCLDLPPPALLFNSAKIWPSFFFF